MWSQSKKRTLQFLKDSLQRLLSFVSLYTIYWLWFAVIIRMRVELGPVVVADFELLSVDICYNAEFVWPVIYALFVDAVRGGRHWWSPGIW